MEVLIFFLLCFLCRRRGCVCKIAKSLIWSFELVFFGVCDGSVPKCFVCSGIWCRYHRGNQRWGGRRRPTRCPRDTQDPALHRIGTHAHTLVLILTHRSHTNCLLVIHPGTSPTRERHTFHHTYTNAEPQLDYLGGITSESKKYSPLSVSVGEELRRSKWYLVSR